jgi:hypothetical protein
MRTHHPSQKESGSTSLSRQRFHASGETRDLPRCRFLVDDTLLGCAHQNGLGCFQSSHGIALFAGGQGFLDLADFGLQARTARLVDLGLDLVLAIDIVLFACSELPDRRVKYKA